MKRLIALASCTLAFSFQAIAQGPTGLGALKLGMSKEAVESLQPSEGVYLNSPMTPYQYGNSAPKEGLEKFDAFLVIPLSPDPLAMVLTFEAAQLTELYITLTDSSNTLERVKAQIAEKYGPGKIEDTMKEEQCIYRGGANFKLSSGVLSTTWTEEYSQLVRIETKLSDIVLATCPSNLRYSIGPIKLKSMTIRKVRSAGEAKPKNLF
jgi:hypothetical protein